MTERSSSWRLGFMAAVLAALSLTIGACGSRSGDNRSAEKTGADFTRRIENIVKNNTGSWPDDVPSDVPMFTQGTIVSTEKALTANGTSWEIRVEGVGEGGFSEYVDELRSEGWDVTGNATPEFGSCRASMESLTLSLRYRGERGTLGVQLRTF